MKKIRIYIPLFVITVLTIGLAFPKDDDIISEEDEIEIVPEDDEVIDDVPEEDDKDIPDDGQEIIPEDDDVEITRNDISTINNDKVDYSKIAGLVVLLSVMITGLLSSRNSETWDSKIF